MPGYNQKVVQLCRQFGNFRPRFIAIGKAANMAEGLAISANVGAISLNPSFISHLPERRHDSIADKEAT